jgi:hypothetical protein
MKYDKKVLYIFIIEKALNWLQNCNHNMYLWLKKLRHTPNIMWRTPRMMDVFILKEFVKFSLFLATCQIWCCKKTENLNRYSPEFIIFFANNYTIDISHIMLHCPQTMASDQDWGRHFHTFPVFLSTLVLTWFHYDLASEAMCNDRASQVTGHPCHIGTFVKGT